MSVVAKKKPKPVRTGKPLHVWLEPALRDAIEEARRRGRRSLRGEVSIALEQYLKGLGLWPPPPPGQLPEED
jgi:hypothetical protein